MNKPIIKSSPVAGKLRNGAVSYYGEIDTRTMAAREVVGCVGLVVFAIVLVVVARLILGDF